MDAGRRELAVALGRGGHEAGLRPELEPRQIQICECRVLDRTSGADMRGFVQTEHPVKTVRGYSADKRLSAIRDTHTATIR